MMTALRAAILAALLFPAALAAQDVTITARDGALEIVGTMRGYDGEVYRVETEFGLLTVDAQGVVCAGPGCPDLTAFVAEAEVAGAASIGQGLFQTLVAGFAEDHGLALSLARDAAGDVTQTLSDTGPAGARVLVRLHHRPGTSDAGLAALDAGQADLALARRVVAGNPRGRVLALDALVPLVARGNPARGIALPDLGGVLTGAVTEWGPLGGDAGVPLRLHLFAADTGLLARLFDLVAPGHTPALPAGAVAHASAADLADAVARDPDALGVGLYSAMGSARPLPLTGDCGIAVVATPHALKTGDYPLGAPLLVYTPPRRLPRVLRDLVGWVSTPAAQRAVRRAGVIDLGAVETAISGQGARLANAVAVAEGAEGLAELQRMAALMAATRRLSITFRFDDGSATLGAQSRGNLDDLARALEAGTYAGREVILVGFSDGTGPAGPNRALALRRAEAVAAALRAAVRLPSDALPRIVAESFGEAMPLACDDTALGRLVNRRVEVWLR